MSINDALPLKAVRCNAIAKLKFWDFESELQTHPFARRAPEDVNITGNFIGINPDRILYFLNKCKSGTSPLPDCIPSDFLKRFRYQLLQPLVALFRNLIDKG